MSCPHYRKLKSLSFWFRSGSVHSPADPRECGKGWPRQTAACQLACWEVTSESICLLSVFSCYFIWFVFPNVLLFLKLFSVVASPQKCSRFHVFLFQTLETLIINKCGEWAAALAKISGFSSMLWVCVISEQSFYSILSHLREKFWNCSQWKSGHIPLKEKKGVCMSLCVYMLPR